MNVQAEFHMRKYFFFCLKRRQYSSHCLLQELPLSRDVSFSLASQCCVHRLSSGSLLEFEYVWRWLFTLRGVCVDWQAFTEIAVYDIRVFILASLQQPPNIKQSLFDSGCAPGSVTSFSLFVQVMNAVLCCLLVSLLGPVVMISV